MNCTSHLTSQASTAIQYYSDKSTVTEQIINSIHICPVMNSRIGELLCICPVLDSWSVNISTYVLLLYICHVYYPHSPHGIPPSSEEHILTIFTGFVVHVLVFLISISLQMLFTYVSPPSGIDDLS